MKLKKILVILIASSLLIIFITSCSNDNSNEFYLGAEGIISDVTLDENKNITSIFVEGEPVNTDEYQLYDKAYISITDNTKIYSDSIDGELSTDKLKVGTKVHVIFDGPVAESYPVQAKALTITIID